MHYTHLAGRALIECSGEDASVFLQGLVSNDVSRLRDGVAVYAALLAPQGKFLHDFFLLPWQNSILIDCDSQSLPDLLQRLKAYRLRSKVTVGAMAENIGVAAIWDDPDVKCQMSNVKNSTSLPFDSCPLTFAFPDPRLPQLGWRIVGDIVAISAWCQGQGMQPADDTAYDRLRLELGVPEGVCDMVREKSLLLEFGFEDLHGVDFRKGCYVGQEVTARSKYRGQVRRFIYAVRAVAGTLPASGTPVMLGDAPAGELRSGLGSIGLALLKVAEVEKANRSGADLYAEGAVLKAMLPPWVSHPPKALTIEE